MRIKINRIRFRYGVASKIPGWSCGTFGDTNVLTIVKDEYNMSEEKFLYTIYNNGYQKRLFEGCI